MPLEKTNVQIIVGVILVTTGFVLGVAWTNGDLSSSQSLAGTDIVETIETNDFTLIAKHGTDDVWNYTVTGVLSSKCATFDMTEVVAESLPEKVTVTLSVSEPADDSLCAQGLKTIEETGTFTASSQANISFEYKEESSRPSVTGLESNKDE